MSKTSPTLATAVLLATSALSGAASAAPVDDGYRTFAGACSTQPIGDNPQSALLATALGIFAPKLAGAAIDAAGAALERAAADRLAEVSVVAPLEYVPDCIVVARGLSLPRTSGKDTAAIHAALERATVMLEVNLRMSADRTAITAQPTRFIYRTPIEGGKAGGKSRKLAATLTFAMPGTTTSTSVTLPLGEFVPGAIDHEFDAVRRWDNVTSTLTYATGAGASIWIKSPFTPIAVAGAPGAPPAGGGGQQVSYAPAGEARFTRIAMQPGFGSTVPPPVVGPAPAVVAVASQSRGLIQPVSLTIKLSETTPGSKFAKALAPVVKSSKDEIVAAVDNLVDPEKLANAEKTKITTFNTNSDAYATAVTSYWTTMQAYCAPALIDKAAIRVKAAELYGAQIKLARAAALIEEKPPFASLVNPETDNKASCPV